jgi:hypothetical protein
MPSIRSRYDCRPIRSCPGWTPAAATRCSITWIRSPGSGCVSSQDGIALRCCASPSRWSDSKTTAISRTSKPVVESVAEAEIVGLPLGVAAVLEEDQLEPGRSETAERLQMREEHAADAQAELGELSPREAGDVVTRRDVAISCPSTVASCASVDIRFIMPLVRKMNPPGSANAFGVGSSTTANDHGRCGRSDTRGESQADLAHVVLERRIVDRGRSNGGRPRPRHDRSGFPAPR